jgi:hypothetical protein
VTWCAKNEHGFRRCAVVGRSELSIDVLASSLCVSQTDARNIDRELLFESQIKEDIFVGPGDDAVFGDRVKRLMLSARDDARADTVGMCWRNGKESLELFEGTDMVVVNRLARDAALYNSYFSLCEDGARDNYSRYAESIKNLHRYIAFWAYAATGGLSARCRALQASGVFNWELTARNLSAKRRFADTAGIPCPTV